MNKRETDLLPQSKLPFDLSELTPIYTRWGEALGEFLSNKIDELFGINKNKEEND